MIGDQGYENQAINLLDSCLTGVDFPNESGIDKKMLIQMYFESRDLCRKNLDDFELSRASRSLWRTCIRVVMSYSTLDKGAAESFINSKIDLTEAKSLYERALKLYFEFQQLQKC